MPVWADDVGIVHLWSIQSALSDAYSLDCDEAGTDVQYQLDRSDPTAFAPATPRVSHPTYAVRPALADPTSPSQAALVQAGYPPRPDPAKAPHMYQQWLDVVSKPATIIPEYPVSRPDVHFDPVDYSTSHAWCATPLDKLWAAYDYAIASYFVPFYSFLGGSEYTQAAPWVGLGGYFVGDNDIIQDGTSIQTVGDVATIQAWREYFSWSPVYNPNMVVSEDDHMYFDAWEGDSACNVGPGHTGYGCFYYEDWTTGVSTGIHAVVEPPEHQFLGMTAEAVIEKWSSPWALTPWIGTPQISFDATTTAQDGEHNLTSDPYVNVTLNNLSGQDLCTVAKESSTNAGFTWLQGY